MKNKIERSIRQLCVFCGANSGFAPQFNDAARQFGSFLAKSKIHLVYGGGGVGLMGAVADGCLESGGSVTGVIPKFLFDREVGHSGLTKLHIVNTMHERKLLMAESSDAFVALPGGFGTLEELFEVVTWAQIGVHQKPCGLLNVDGFFDPLIEFIYQASEKGFIRSGHLEFFQVDHDFDRLLNKLMQHKLPDTSQWIADKT